MRTTTRWISGVIIAATVLACGPGGSTSDLAPAPAAAGNEFALAVRAQNIWFDPTLLRAPTGRALVITLWNQDLDVPHGVALMAGRDSSVKLGASEIVTGPAMSVLRVPGLVAGDYRLLCEVHPTMTVDLEIGV